METKNDVLPIGLQHKEIDRMCNLANAKSINPQQTCYVKNNVEGHLGSLQENSDIAVEGDAMDTLMYSRYRLGGSVESLLSQASNQNIERTILRHSKSQNALDFDFRNHQECSDSKPEYPKIPDVVDDVVGDEVLLKYFGQVFEDESLMECRLNNSLSFICSQDARMPKSKSMSENFTPHKEHQDCERRRYSQNSYKAGQCHDMYQEPIAPLLPVDVQDKEAMPLEPVFEQAKNPEIIISYEELDSAHTQAAESDGSHNISVSLLKSVLKEREVKINDLSHILKRERTEKLRLIEEKEQLLSEIETLRNEFKVMTFDKERKKQDAFNSFDPNSPVVLQKEIVNLKSQINDLQEANESAVIELAKADEEISQNKKDMARLKADYNHKLEDSHEEIKLLKEKINQIPNICCHTEDNDDGLLREISQLRSECRRLRTHSHQLSEQNHHLQEEMWDIKRRYESLLKRTTCFPSGQDNGESVGPHTDLYNKGSFSKDWISEENSLYRNDAFKVDGTFSKCKAVLGSPNIKEPWESKHEERFTNNASPFSMDSENTDLLIVGYHEDSPHKPSQTGMGVGSYEPKALNDNDLFSVKNKDSTPWNSPHQSPKAAAARASFCKLVGNTRMNLSVLPRRPFAPKTVDDLKVGNLVKFSRPAGKISKGTIQYKGYLRGREEIYLGVELEGNEVGKHDGTFQGARYFLCKPNKGVFVNFNKIIMAWE